MPEPWRTPFASSEPVRRRMSRQRREGTAPELALRRALHSLGLRYRVHRAPLSGLRRKADVVFGPARIAVFVDGCFWHGCPEHGHRVHQINNWYWPDKIARNRRRDQDTDETLRNAGWLPLRVWEHEVPSAEAAAGVALHLRDLVRQRAPKAGLTPSGPPSPGHTGTGGLL